MRKISYLQSDGRKSAWKMGKKMKEWNKLEEKRQKKKGKRKMADDEDKEA